MMRGLLDKLDAAEVRLSNLDTIERGLNDLFAQFAETRASAIEIAERAARSAVREAAIALAPRTPQPVPTVEPARRSESEPRQESRAAVVRQPLPEPVPSRPAPRPAPVMRTEPITAVRESVPPAPTPPEPARPEPLPTEPALPGTSGKLPPDFPLEPGSGAPRSRMIVDATERVAQSEAGLAPIAPKQAEGAPRAADFIAAARRAAQEAAAEKAAEMPHSRAVGVVKDLGASLGNNRRSLLIGALAVLLIVAGAIRYGDVLLPGFFSSEQPATVSPAAPPTATPEPEPADPVPPTPPPPSRSALPADPTLAAIPPAGVLSPVGETPLLVPNADPRDATGSVKPTKPAAVAFLPKDLPAAIGPAPLRAAALAGDPAASYEIAARYFEGRGIEANATEAMRWFELARAAGSAPAAFRLGGIYEKGGQGVDKNLAEARRYYLIAAEGGHIKAMHNLAVLYAEGADGKPDFRSAARWFRMAADRGLRDSQYNLGVLFARGLGVDANLAESYRWFALAAIQGDTDADKKRDDVIKRLDPQTLEAARLAVETWKAVPIDTAANAVQLNPEWEKQAVAPARKRSVKN
jgi:localization factor PodJL